MHVSPFGAQLDRAPVDIDVRALRIYIRELKKLFSFFILKQTSFFLENHCTFKIVCLALGRTFSDWTDKANDRVALLS